MITSEFKDFSDEIFQLMGVRNKSNVLIVGFDIIFFSRENPPETPEKRLLWRPNFETVWVRFQLGVTVLR